MGCVVTDVATAFTPRSGDRILPFVKPGHYLHQTDPLQPRWMDAFRTTLSHGDIELLAYQGQLVPSFDLQLNTVLAVGNDPLCLFAKLHAQCEIYAWVEGEHRSWMADVIEQGQQCGLYRSGAGWDDVVKLLRLSSNGSVVTSYSVTDSFPNSYVANWQAPAGEDGEPDDDAWYELPDGERWDLAMSGLRASRDVPPLTPGRLRAKFGQRLTLIDIFAQEQP